MSARDDYSDLARFSDGFLKSPCPPEDHCSECLAAAQASTALEDIDRLRRWKAEATAVITEWDAIWEAAGRPGRLGESKASGVRALLAEHLEAEAPTAPDDDDHNAQQALGHTHPYGSRSL